MTPNKKMNRIAAQFGLRRRAAVASTGSDMARFETWSAAFGVALRVVDETQFSVVPGVDSDCRAGAIWTAKCIFAAAKADGVHMPWPIRLGTEPA